MLKIVTVPAHVLTTPSAAVTEFDGALRTLIAQMTETLEAQSDPEGVGLAAPQVGVAKTLFIMKPTKESKVQTCINPKILTIEAGKSRASKTRKKSAPLEGCLSIPRIWSPVKRPRKVQLEYQDLGGKKTVKWFFGFPAVIVQHEVDHLHGILFTQRALEQQSPLLEEKDGKLKRMNY